MVNLCTLGAGLKKIILDHGGLEFIAAVCVTLISPVQNVLEQDSEFPTDH